MIWLEDPRALGLLDDRGSPFSSAAFRSAVMETVPGWRDATFAARAGDGTVAAVALLARRGVADSVPPWGYGGVVSSRTLDAGELAAFLIAARIGSGTSVLRVRQLEYEGHTGCGREIGVASVIVLSGEHSHHENYARLARRSIKTARAAGATVLEASSIAAFASLYAVASKHWSTRYPMALIERLLAEGLVKIHDVWLKDEVVASLVTLSTGGHWMCWLAAQSAEGRSVSASYLAYDAVLAEAASCGVPFVNLGTSVAGGRDFKHHLGAVGVEMTETVVASRVGFALHRGRGLAGRVVRRARRFAVL